MNRIALVMVMLFGIVTIACQKKNEPPVINSISADPDSVTPGQATKLTVDAEDPDGDELTLTWSAASGSLSAHTGTTVNWTLPNTVGNYTITVTAKDPGELTDEANKSIKVYQNTDTLPHTDTLPPASSITNPYNGETIKTPTTTITASASDNIGVAKVEFWIDNSLVGTDYTAPYEYIWSIVNYPNLSWHSIYAKAYDAANNSGQSSTISACVQNRGYEETYNWVHYPIYDSSWTYDPVVINSAPSQAIVDSVFIGFNIDHTYPADLWVQLRSPQNTVGLIYNYGQCPGGYVSFTTTGFAGETVNGTWYLEVFDGYPGDIGNIIVFHVGVFWKFQ